MTRCRVVRIGLKLVTLLPSLTKARHAALLLFALGSTSLLFACSAGEKGKDPQLVARGKDFEVTIPELEQLLRAAPRVEREQVASARRAVLDRLVDEKLLAEAATDARLDREVDTMQTIEAARRGILARAFAERIAAEAPKPSAAEIEAAYRREGEAGNIRALVIDELTVATNAPPLETLAKTFDRGGLDALTAGLTAAGLPAQRGRTRLPIEDLRAIPANRLATLVIGDQIVFRIGDVAHFGRIAAIERASVAPAEARAAIAARLLAARRQALVQQRIARLRAERAVVVKDPSTGRAIAQIP
jgi:EpsD family peptidyl-prolyl cis-trans isomerase